MEQWQRNVIKMNLSRLVKDTTFDFIFLSRFIEKNILTKQEVERINSNRTSSEKAYDFYKTIETRLESYAVLLEALAESNQTGVREILLSTESSSQLTESSLKHHLVKRSSLKSENVLVGDDDCSYADVSKILKEDTVMLQQWREVFHGLNVDPEVIERNRRDYLMNSCTSFDIYNSCLRSWRNQASKEATLSRLISELRKCNLNKVADDLEEKFKTGSFNVNNQPKQSESVFS